MAGQFLWKKRLQGRLWFPRYKMANIRRKNISQLDGIHVKDTSGPADLEVGTSEEQLKNRFPNYPYEGYHRYTIAEYLNGGGASPYSRQLHGGTQADREGLYWYNRHIQRLEMLIQSTGDIAVLLRRKFTGEICSCYDGRRGQSRNRCPICVTPETKIMVENYLLKAIQDLKVGEMVLTHKGSYQSIVQIFKHEVKEWIYEIKTNHARHIEITGEHPVFVVRKKFLKCSRSNKRRCVPGRRLECTNCTKNPIEHLEEVMTKNLQVGDSLVFPIVSLENEKSLGATFVRLLGYYISEGSIVYEKRSDRGMVPVRVEFGLNQNEAKTLGAEIEALILELTGKKMIRVIGKKHKGLTLTVYDEELVKKLEKHGGRYAAEKRLSKEVISIPVNELWQMFGAIFNGDGSLTDRKNTNGTPRVDLVLSTVSESLVSQLEVLAASRLGLILPRYETTSYPKSFKVLPKESQKGFKIYKLIVNGKDVAKLAPFLTNEKQSFQKFQYDKSTVHIIGRYIVYPVIQIKRKFYEGLVYNLEVTKDNSYIANRLAVHNCFGTGFVGGYVRYVNCREPEGRIWVRLSPTEEDLDQQEDGMRQKFLPNCWCLPSPIIRDRDVLVLFDPETGEETWRYEVLAVTRNRGFFRKFTQQTFNMHQFEKTDPIYNVEVLGTAYNAVGDLAGPVDPLYDPHPGYGHTDPQTGYGEAYQDRGFSEGFVAGYEKGYKDAIDQKDFDPSLDPDFYGTIESPYGANDPKYNEAMKQNYLFGWEEGYRDGWKDGEAKLKT